MADNVPRGQLGGPDWGSNLCEEGLDVGKTQLLLGGT